MKNLTLPKPRPFNPNLNVPQNNSSYINNELHTPNQLPDPYSCDNVIQSQTAFNNTFTSLPNNRKITLGSDYESWDSTNDILDNFDNLIKYHDNVKQTNQPKIKLSKEDEELLNNFIKSHNNSTEI